MTRRIKRRNRDEGKKTYRTRDNIKLKVLFYLVSQPDGSWTNKIIHDAGIGSQHWDNFKRTMKEMVEFGWIELTEYQDREVYKITAKYKISNEGRNVCEKAKDIIMNRDNPLIKLDAFKGIEAL